MPSKTDPAIVIWRMRCDANRLSQWAKKYGSAAQQRKASQLVDALELAICPIFPVTRDDCMVATKSPYWSDPVRMRARNHPSSPAVNTTAQPARQTRANSESDANDEPHS